MHSTPVLLYTRHRYVKWYIATRVQYVIICKWPLYEGTLVMDLYVYRSEM